MKSVFSIIASLFLASAASANEVITTLETENGGVAYLVTSQPVKSESSVVLFYKLFIEIDGELYRVSGDSAQVMEGLLCEPIKGEFPYPYTTLETPETGILGIGAEKVATIDENHVVSIAKKSPATVVVNSSCGKEMY